VKIKGKGNGWEQVSPVLPLERTMRPGNHDVSGSEMC